MKEEELYRDLLLKTVDRFPPYPEGRFRGRGIVLCAGGLTHLSNAYVCMKFLREFTNLPIELFHAGDIEMPDAVREYLQKDFAPIIIRDITEPRFRDAYPFLPLDHFRGCHIKPHALLHSTFEEIFFIDADNIPLQSPEPLFTAAEYLRTGAIFWPDLESTKSTTTTLFRTFGITTEKLQRGFEFETGQIVLDKRRCWQALLTVCLANSDMQGFREFCYRHTLGDKDTFRLAFRFAGKSYHLVSSPSQRCGSRFFLVPIPLTRILIKIQHDLGSYYSTGMLQFDLSGNPLFAHKTVCEWSVYLDFRSLLYLEDRGGNIQPAPLLAAWENRGYGYLKEFKDRYLETFGRNRFRELQGLAARVITKILDGVSCLRASYSGKSAQEKSGLNKG